VTAPAHTEGHFVLERAYAPRRSASVGAAIRQARAGRYSLAELARRSRTSVGILSLIERGQGNPSFETLARIADALEVSLTSLIEGGTGAAIGGPALRGPILEGPWDDAAESPAQDVADSSTTESVTVLRPGSPTGWRDSMILRPGQGADVLVRSGTVELTLRDRSAEYEADGVGQPLSVDISVRGRPYVSQMELPPVGDPRWERLVGGETSFRPTALACQILFTHVTRSVRDDPSPSNVCRWVADLRAVLLKYEDLTAGELARVLG
jgi:transcriptional regulator with XRE-family HTH domain